MGIQERVGAGQYRQQAVRKKGRKPKYGNCRCEYLGIKFDSRKERRRYLQLLALEKAGKVRDLELQVKFPLHCNGIRVCHYVCDFQYYCLERHGLVVEDVKSPVTAKNPVYRLKRKMVKAEYNIDIQEV